MLFKLIYTKNQKKNIYLVAAFCLCMSSESNSEDFEAKGTKKICYGKQTSKNIDIGRCWW